MSTYWELASDSESLPKFRVAVSVAGGIGITLRSGQRRVYIEVYNSGESLAAFSIGREEPEIIPFDAQSEPSLSYLGSFVRSRLGI